MRRIITILAVIGLVSCQRPPPQTTVDAQFVPYLEAFMQQAHANGRWVDDSRLSIEMSDYMPTPQTLGYCQIFDETQLVVISRAWWNSAGFAISDREELIFHELRHCLLGLVHVNTLTGDGIPTTIMNAHHFAGALYAVNREAYIAEEFNALNVQPLYWFGTPQATGYGED